MIYNINPDTFDILGQGLRNGDIVALANAVEHIRIQEKNPNIKFYMRPQTINSAPYCKQFYQFICGVTDYFSYAPGTVDLPFKKVHLWDFRSMTGDLVKIQNSMTMQKKIVVFPLYDAPYNIHRNWSQELFSRILLFCNYNYPTHEKIVCAKDDIRGAIDLCGFDLSTDFMTNIKHIMDCEIFVGGDTGVSHFASVLDRGPQELIYYYSDRSMIHSLPFYSLEGKGIINKFWTNFEGTTW